MSVENRIAEAGRIIEELRRIAKEPLPDDPFDAAGKKWSGLADVAMDGVMSIYDESARGADSQRVIPFLAAYQILAQAEQEMAEEVIKDPAQLAVQKLAGIAAAIEYLVKNWQELFMAIKAAWQADALIEFMLGYMIEIVAISALKKAMAQAFKTSERFERRMRARALPQSSGKRFWRKRVARQ